MCAAPASNLGQNYRCAAASKPWLGRLEGGLWCAVQRRPVQQLCKPQTLKRTRTHKPWMGDVAYHARRQCSTGKTALQQRTQLVDLHIALSHPTSEGSENGRSTSSSFMQKNRSPPRSSNFFMHFRKEWNWKLLPAIDLRPQESIIQPQVFGRRRRPPVQPNALSGQGKLSSQLWI